MFDKDQLLKNVFSLIDNYSISAINLSDYLTDHPEVSGSEINSSGKIVELLRRNEIDVEFPFCNIDYAFKAEICGCNNPEFRLAILAEYDALPDIGHACGHSVSGAISVLSALALSELNGKLPIEVDLIGTPDEEVVGSKTILADAGVFDQYDSAIMIHMAPRNVPAFRTLAVKDLEVTFNGLSGHAAASPWEGKNALNGLQLFYHAVDMLRQHVKPDVRMHGIIKEGGHAANVIPDVAKAHFFIRSSNYEYLEEVIKMVKDCAVGAGIATQTTVKTIQLYPPYYEIIPNEIGEHVISEIFNELGLAVDSVDTPTGSTDMGNVSYRCPVFHPMLSISDEPLNLHTKEFSNALKSEKAHGSIIDGSKIIISFIVELLINENLLSRIKHEHNDRLIQIQNTKNS